MHARARVPEEPKGRDRASAAIADRREAELAAIALLCLMFASPAEEPDQSRSRPVSR